MDDPSAPSTAGDVNFSKGILVLTVVLTSLSTIVTGFRLAVRQWIVEGLGWDDYTILLATVRPVISDSCSALILNQVGTVIGAALDGVEIHYGFGRHRNFLTPHELQEFQKYAYGEWIQTFATLMWTKVSICLFLLRIPFTKYLVRPLQVALVVLIVSNIILTVLWIVQCRPVAAVWDSTIEGQCFSHGQVQNIIFAQASKLWILSVDLALSFDWRIHTYISINVKIFHSDLCHF